MPQAQQEGWMDYWRENMAELGLQVPLSWMGTKGAVEATIGALVAAVKQFGTKVTVRELIGAGLMSEKWAMQGYLTAAGLAGAMIGSAAVATGRSISGGTRIADVFSYAFTKGWATPTVTNLVFKHPQIYQADHPARPFYSSRSGPR